MGDPGRGRRPSLARRGLPRAGSREDDRWGEEMVGGAATKRIWPLAFTERDCMRPDPTRHDATSDDERAGVKRVWRVIRWALQSYRSSKEARLACFGSQGRSRGRRWVWVVSPAPHRRTAAPRGLGRSVVVVGGHWWSEYGTRTSVSDLRILCTESAPPPHLALRTWRQNSYYVI